MNLVGLFVRHAGGVAILERFRQGGNFSCAMKGLVGLSRRFQNFYDGIWPLQHLTVILPTIKCDFRFTKVPYAFRADLCDIGRGRMWRWQ